jgi:predicted nuclease of predicted toxin-antitoxin system
VKLLLDQNLSRVLIRRLSDEYPESVHVAEIGLDTATDLEIWEYAGERDYVIVSKDSGPAARSVC